MILRVPVKLVKRNSKLLFQQYRSFIADAINHVVGAAVLVKIDLGAWTLQIPVVIEQLQSTQNLLSAAADEGHNVGGTQKTVPVNEPDDMTISGRQAYGTN